MVQSKTTTESSNVAAAAHAQRFYGPQPVCLDSSKTKRPSKGWSFMCAPAHTGSVNKNTHVLVTRGPEKPLNVLVGRGCVHPYLVSALTICKKKKRKKIITDPEDTLVLFLSLWEMAHLQLG